MFSMINFSNDLLIFGGLLLDGTSVDETWVMSLGNWRWHNFETSIHPNARHGAASCKYINNKNVSMIIGGGQSKDVKLNDMYIFSE